MERDRIIERGESRRPSRAAGHGAACAAIACVAALLPAAAVAAPTASPSPDPRRGEALYVGAERFSAGGAPCLGCHGIAGHGLARAASFGPDLTAAHAQYGAEGLAGLLEDVVFPSMAPIYREHAVTPAERADLVAFLGEAAGARQTGLGVSFAGGVAAAAAGFLALVVALGRRGQGRRARASASAGRTP